MKGVRPVKPVPLYRLAATPNRSSLEALGFGLAFDRKAFDPPARLTSDV
jgi:hypothetical protein